MNSKRVVRAAGIAKRLMQLGHICVDIAPQRGNPSATCFVFFKDPWLQVDIDRIMETKALDDAVLAERLAKLGMTKQEYQKTIFDACLEDGAFDGT